MSQLSVDNIVGFASTAPTYMPDGFSVPSDAVLTIEGDVYNNPTGIATVGILTVSNATVSSAVTATTFYGDGSQLPTARATVGKAIAFVLIRP